WAASRLSLTAGLPGVVQVGVAPGRLPVPPVPPLPPVPPPPPEPPPPVPPPGRGDAPGLVAGAAVVGGGGGQAGSAAVASARSTAVWASSTRDCAESTVACVSVGSILARTCPALTVSPALMSTSVNVPATLKLRPRVLAALIVPAADTA